MRVRSAVSALTQAVMHTASQTQLTLQLYRARPDTLTQLHRSYVGHCQIH
jgi:flagellin-specific chaperone FliS